MILGRSPVLWYALLVAAVNVAIVLGVVHLDDSQLGAIDAAALALLGVIANERDPLSVGTLAMTIHAPAPVASVTAPAVSPSPTAASITASLLPSIANVIDPISLQAAVALIDRLTTPVAAPVTPAVPIATVPVPVQPAPAPTAPTPAATATGDAIPSDVVNQTSPAVPPVSAPAESAWAQSNSLPPDGA